MHNATTFIKVHMWFCSMWNFGGLRVAPHDVALHHPGVLSARIAYCEEFSTKL